MTKREALDRATETMQKSDGEVFDELVRLYYSTDAFYGIIRTLLEERDDSETGDEQPNQDTMRDV